MSDPTPYSDAFSKFVPGFEFLQGLVRNAGQSLPTVGQWVAPTLDPAELDRRIQELRTVQFWLEQNARMIGTTVQALEVQRMTLGALRTMNVPLADLGEALKVRPAAPVPAPPAPAPAPAPAPTPVPAPSAGEAAPAVDPVQWWGALTQQFTELASQALQAAPAVAAAAAAVVEPTPAEAAPGARHTAPRKSAPRTRKSPSSAA